jgi:2-polyprenyl-3-methyl-5-hydroxy-6-metoxy-1,4-benzoquinol methylase
VIGEGSGTRFGKNWNPAEHYKNSDIANAYDESRFSSPAGRLFDRLEKRCVLSAFATIQPGSRIADIPCGTGRLTEILLEQGYSVDGMDISPQMLAVAAQRLDRFGARFRTRVVDARTLHGPDTEFDGVLCARVLMHFPYEEQVAFLRAVSSITSGPIVFTQGVATPWHWLRRRIKRLLGRQRPASFPLSRNQIRTLLADAALEEIWRRPVLPVLSESWVLVARRKSGLQ